MEDYPTSRKLIVPVKAQKLLLDVFVTIAVVLVFGAVTSGWSYL